MKAKRIITVILLVFVGCSVAYLVAKEWGGNFVASETDKSVPVAVETPEDDLQQAAESVTLAEAEHTVIAYYFHGNFRCPTCRRIEAFSEEAIRGGFAQELEDGRLRWRVINIEEPENRHFIKDYRLYTRSLVLIDMRDGEQARWKNLARVWELVRDKEAFGRYVQDEVREYLGVN